MVKHRFRDLAWSSSLPPQLAEAAGERVHPVCRLLTRKAVVAGDDGDRAQPARPLGQAARVREGGGRMRAHVARMPAHVSRERARVESHPRLAIAGLVMLAALITALGLRQVAHRREVVRLGYELSSAPPSCAASTSRRAGCGWRSRC